MTDIWKQVTERWSLVLTFKPFSSSSSRRKSTSDEPSWDMLNQLRRPSMISDDGA